MAGKIYPYQVVDLHMLTNHVLSLKLKPTEEAMPYLAGQYLEVVLPEFGGRPFSIANAPLGNHQIELHIRHSADNPFTCALIKHIQAQGHLNLQGPFGQCVLNITDGPLVFIAHGTGFAPMKALIEQSFLQHTTCPSYLYWGVHRTSDLYLDSLPRQWSAQSEDFHYKNIVTPDPDDHKITQNLIEAIQSQHADLTNFHVFGAGRTEVILTIFDYLTTLGLPKNHRHSDALL